MKFVNVDILFGWLSACLSIFIYIVSIKISVSSFRVNGKYMTIPYYIRIENILNYFVCSNWLIYSYIFNNIHLFTCNLIGTIFYFLWIIFIYLIYFRRINCFKYLVFIILAFIYIPFILFLFGFSLNIGGPICVAFNIISFFPSILMIKEVIANKNYRLIKIKTNLLKLIAHLCWYIYGFIIINLNIVIPNVIGFIISFALAFFWNIFKKKSGPEKLNNRSIEVMRNRTEYTI